jgi:hypothetical protein
MKIVNDIACNFNSNSIIEKWCVNWWKQCWEYGVGIFFFLKFKKCLSIPIFTHEWYKQIVVLKCQSDDLQLIIYQT